MIGWPAALWLVRHGESEGNVANALARRSGAPRLEIELNDIEVPLSDLGQRQAAALGRWWAGVEPDSRPTMVLVSPYVRARETARIALDAAGWSDLQLVADERLRDREQGWLDRLTAVGIGEDFPAEAQRRRYVGKFWYRPPGGESWADVAQRIRAVLLELRLAAAGERVLVVTHDVPLLMTRYVLEAMTPEESVALSGVVANCGLTRYVGDAGGLALETFNDTRAQERDDESVVTSHE